MNEQRGSCRITGGIQHWEKQQRLPVSLDFFTVRTLGHRKGRELLAPAPGRPVWAPQRLSCICVATRVQTASRIGIYFRGVVPMPTVVGFVFKSLTCSCTPYRDLFAQKERN